MIIIHIYGARDIILIFGDHQGTESKLLEMVNIVVGPIFTQRKIRGIYGTTISISYKMGGK